ncbi:apolipoprotein N-acyltransferase [Arenicella xantha]|uniref:Apolipoprotein N-acyltransferase n=1 Tax=Arenicella xantha TaxID=644221 RepID=A0A395JIE6_9GAMM|nr:apolipoprotein N-acyltransferase [Arenicella xantha]RBP49643.1 apolipoprotein N-acyltransferase [Arenicella xantha]
MKNSGWRGLGASFVSGALLVLAFAPFGFWLLAPLCMVAFFSQLINSSPKVAMLRGLAFGLGLYGFGVSWVYVSLSTYGGMPFWMGSIAVLGFAGILASLIAIMAWLVARSTPAGSTLRLFMLPFAWCVFEWLKSWVLTGFPWLDLGYTQTDTWLSGWAPIGGVYLVSFMVCLISVLTSAIFKTREYRMIPLIAALIGLSWSANYINWTKDDGTALRVAIVQADVPINQKWQSDSRARVIENYRTQSRALAAGSQLDLVVWPETALPIHLQHLTPEFWQTSVPVGTALLTGLIDTPSLLDHAPSYDRSYNAAALVCNVEDGVPQVYRKRHLVPFGEYLPLRFLFQWVLDYLELPMSDFYAGSGMQPLSCGSRIKIGLSICYEDAFADEYRRYLGDAGILVNIGEDAWFGDSFAPHQRLQMAQMRARELSRPMVRSANSGPSAFIDHRGVITAQSLQFTQANLVERVYPQIGTTWYYRFGSWIVLFSGIIWLLAGLLSIVTASRSNTGR